MRYLFLALVMLLPFSLNATVVNVQTVATMVAIPAPAYGLQIFVATPSVYYFYGTDGAYHQYANLPASSPVTHYVQVTSPATPGPVLMIPAPSPGVTIQIIRGLTNNIGYSATPTAFHFGSSATPTSGGTIYGQATFQNGFAANIVGPYSQSTPAAPVSQYIDSGLGPIQTFLEWLQSDGK